MTMLTLELVIFPCFSLNGVENEEEEGKEPSKMAVF